METMMGDARERTLADIGTPRRGVVQKVLVRVGHKVDISQPLVELLGDLPGGDAVNEFVVTSPVNGIVVEIFVRGRGIHRANPGSTVLMTIATDADALQRLREHEAAQSSGSQPPETSESMAAAIAHESATKGGEALNQDLNW